MNKKGDLTEKQILYIFYAVIAILILATMGNLLIKVSNDSQYKEKFTAYDLSYIISSVAASPSNVEVKYSMLIPLNTIVNKQPCKVSVSSSNEQFTGAVTSCLTSLLQDDYTFNQANNLIIIRMGNEIKIK